MTLAWEAGDGFLGKTHTFTKFDIKEISVATEESVKRVGGTVGWGWCELLIDFYNAALDFSQIVFENHVTNTRFSFHNIYFDQGGRICFKTMDKIQISVNGQTVKRSNCQPMTSTCGSRF
ncbi:hypothetical protein HLH17_06735 [Acinetobacter sp. ANC 5380]|uniref:Uncharacterized protein n=1 Tax=Acinetobacter terrae TaxID=2731247 RepID=A0A7Y2REN0_9GAMM|nr:hypothetical protein [Acinetobacter terrae]NNH77370.1 hypothetical protein [Acinetobacter terrae]